MALLEVHEVSHRFGGNLALDRVSLGADEGRITGLIGPNGAGKSTLFGVVAGALAPAEGRVTLAGHDLERCTPHRRARLGVGRTFQRMEPFGSLTVRESIGLAAAVQRRLRPEQPPVDAEQIVARLGLERIADRRTDMLSTGQGRLAELGRALAIRPRLLLLDEPASGLDETETERLAAVLHELADSGIAVLLVEHDMSLVMQACSLIHVLDHGVLIATGSPSEVRADPGVRASYLGDGSAPRRPILVKENAMTNAAPNERLDRLSAELDAGRLSGSRPDRDASRARFGGLLLVAGVVLGVIAYFLSHRTTDPFIQNDALVVAAIGISTSIAGAAVYIRHGFAAALAGSAADRRDRA